MNVPLEIFKEVKLMQNVESVNRSGNCKRCGRQGNYLTKAGLCFQCGW